MHGEQCLSINFSLEDLVYLDVGIICPSHIVYLGCKDYLSI